MPSVYQNPYVLPFQTKKPQLLPGLMSFIPIKTPCFVRFDPNDGLFMKFKTVFVHVPCLFLFFNSFITVFVLTLGPPRSTSFCRLLFLFFSSSPGRIGFCNGFGLVALHSDYSNLSILKKFSKKTKKKGKKAGNLLTKIRGHDIRSTISVFRMLKFV
jgi:hypothetical protein